MLARKELKLYEIQDKIVNACRQEMKYNKKIILQAATGVGKTI
jgi:superfamily II DNA or RNA helicase